MNESEQNNLKAFGIAVARLGLKDDQDILRLIKRIQIFVRRARETQQTKSLTMKGREGSFFFRILPNGTFEVDPIPVAKQKLKPKQAIVIPLPTPVTSRQKVVAKLIKTPTLPLASESSPQPEPSYCSPREFLELLDCYGFKKLLQRDKDLLRFLKMDMDALIEPSEARGLLKFRFQESIKKGRRAGQTHQRVKDPGGNNGYLLFQFNPKGQGQVQVIISYREHSGPVPQ